MECRKAGLVVHACLGCRAAGWEQAAQGDGTTCEALFFAVYHKMDGTNDEVISMGSIADKLRAFNFETIELADGHDFAQILPALDAPHNGMPKAIVAHTVKGKGVSFMENTCKWHGTAPNRDQLEEALKEIQYTA